MKKQDAANRVQHAREALLVGDKNPTKSQLLDAIIRVDLLLKRLEDDLRAA